MLNGSQTLLFSMTDGITLGSARAIRWAAVAFVTVLTAAASQVSIPLPFTPVPLTLQPMVVLLGGAALGSRLGFSSQVLYLLAGLAGLPVFAASPALPQGALRKDVRSEADREGFGWIEGWRGDVFVALETGADGKIRRCHCHDPSWQNWPALEHAAIDNIVPDFPLINKSFNLSYAGPDL